MKQIIRRLAAAAFAVVVLCVSCIVPIVANSSAVDLSNPTFSYLQHIELPTSNIPGWSDAEKWKAFIGYNEEHCYFELVRSALTDPAWGTQEEGTYRRALQASKVSLELCKYILMSDGSYQEYRALWLVPTFGLYWWDGQDNPHFKITCSGPADTSDKVTYYEMFVYQEYGSPEYRVVYDEYINGSFNGQATEYFQEFTIRLYDLSSIQDMSFNRFFNLIGGFTLQNPIQGAIDYTEAYEEGYGVGRQEGYSAGWKEGEAEGEVIGYSDGYMTGFAEGDTKGYGRGKDEGFHQGQTDALNSTSTFKDMVFAIFDAPGRLIGSMLNFDLFGVNLLGLVKTLLTLTITAAIGFFVVKFWIAGKG